MTSRHAISRLLAGRDRLSRPEKEQILEHVLAEVAPRRRPRWWLATVPAVAAAVVLLLVLALPRGREHAELAARGGGSAIGAFEPMCARCTAGDKILFDLNGTTGYRYFAAFSQRADGTVLWYFPSSDDAVSLDLSRHLGRGVLDHGIVIGREHLPGPYRVFGVFSNEPLSRAQIRERFDATRVAAGTGTSVIEQSLVVR